MDEPVEVQSRRVEMAVPPPPPAYGPAPGHPSDAPVAQRVVATSSATIPPGYRTRQAVWLALIVVDVILGLRFVFYAVGANAVGFASAVYKIGAALDAPFRGIFNVTLDPSGHPLQWADLLAIVVYIFAAWVVTKMILILSTRERNIPAY
jgi:hypothetical protein